MQICAIYLGIKLIKYIPSDFVKDDFEDVAIYYILSHYNDLAYNTVDSVHLGMCNEQ